jgi:hypothetical protein
VRSNCPAFQATRRNANADDNRNTHGDATAHLDASPHADGDAHASTHTVDQGRLLRESRLVARFAPGLVH